MMPTNPRPNKPYAYQDFPSTRYNQQGQARTVRSAEEELALGPGWSKEYVAPPAPPSPDQDPVEAALENQKARFDRAYGDLRSDYDALKERYDDLLKQYTDFVAKVAGKSKPVAKPEAEEPKQ